MVRPDEDPAGSTIQSASAFPPGPSFCVTPLCDGIDSDVTQNICWTHLDALHPPTRILTVSSLDHSSKFSDRMIRRRRERSFHPWVLFDLSKEPLKKLAGGIGLTVNSGATRSKSTPTSFPPLVHTVEYLPFLPAETSRGDSDV